LTDFLDVAFLDFFAGLDALAFGGSDSESDDIGFRFGGISVEI
jgi:hypothetical protein